MKNLILTFSGSSHTLIFDDVRLEIFVFVVYDPRNCTGMSVWDELTSQVNEEAVCLFVVNYLNSSKRHYFCCMNISVDKRYREFYYIASDIVLIP